MDCRQCKKPLKSKKDTTIMMLTSGVNFRLVYGFALLHNTCFKSMPDTMGTTDFQGTERMMTGFVNSRLIIGILLGLVTLAYAVFIALDFAVPIMGAVVLLFFAFDAQDRKRLRAYRALQ